MGKSNQQLDTGAKKKTQGNEEQLLDIFFSRSNSFYTSLLSLLLLASQMQNIQNYTSIVNREPRSDFISWVQKLVRIYLWHLLCKS